METGAMKVLVTGSRGFIGKNLIEGLKRRGDISVTTFDRGQTIGELEDLLKKTDVIYHLAGVNRPPDESEFAEVNAGLTKEIINRATRLGKMPRIVFTSSIQAGLENPYGRSKKAAEEALVNYNKSMGAKIAIYRLPGVFGKWSRPNYNTVVATFCHNIARGLDVSISDRQKTISLVYIDDVVNELLSLLSFREETGSNCGNYREIAKTYTITLGELADKIHEIKRIRETLVIPDLSDEFMRCLHATYLSFLQEEDFSYPLDVKTDARGSLFEVLKSKQTGQIFISKSHKGILRGNHYHNSKIEKFCVIKGKAVIRFRQIFSKEIISYHVSDERIEIVDIPPGYTHAIENLSDGEMIVFFWANQIFDPNNIDTYGLEV